MDFQFIDSVDAHEGIAAPGGAPARHTQSLVARPKGLSRRRSTRGHVHDHLRVGIMGGTFDPIHNGHLVAASEVAWVYDLDEVVFSKTPQL